MPIARFDTEPWKRKESPGSIGLKPCKRPVNNSSRVVMPKVWVVRGRTGNHAVALAWRADLCRKGSPLSGTRTCRQAYQDPAKVAQRRPLAAVQLSLGIYPIGMLPSWAASSSATGASRMNSTGNWSAVVESRRGVLRKGPHVRYSFGCLGNGRWMPRKSHGLVLYSLVGLFGKATCTRLRNPY